jgi:sensor c-di-GMP phosphodiesterase-like protein
LVSPRYKQFAAIAVGVVLAGMPVVALNMWLSAWVERQARAELEQSVRRHLALSESRIGAAAAVLKRLAENGVDSCNARDIALLRQATFDTIVVKEFSIVSADGWTLCTDMGNRTMQRELLSSEPLSPGSDTWLEVVRVDARRERWLRVRRAGAGAGKSIAALLPAEVFVPRVSTAGGPIGFHVQAVTGGGAVIMEAGGMRADRPRPGSITLSVASDRYPLRLITSGMPAQLASAPNDLREVAVAVSGVLVVLIGVLLLLIRGRRRNDPIAELERALKAGEFVPYYHPVVDIRSGQLRGAEVLIRWRKPDGTIVLPGAFIPLAESSGLIMEMTRSLMRRVCQETSLVLGQRPDINVGFNLTARHFVDEAIVDDVRGIFANSPLRLSQVVLEMTERDPIESLTVTRRVVAALQGLGCRVAIDDVGTGHSGLSYMLKLGVDMIKVDKLFIDAMGSDRKSVAIIETLVDLATNLRMEVVAEGVEKFEQVLQLRDLGIRAAQGYVFSPPLPSSAFLQLVEAIAPIPSAVDRKEAAGVETMPARSDAA